MRKYSLDAIRNVKLLMSDDGRTIKLHNKNLCSNQYNDILITIYDACILFLEGVYHNNQYPAIREHNLKELVEAVSNRHYNLCNECSDYARLYHIYELVYNNYKYASFDDVKYAVGTLNAIIKLYISECPITDLEFACTYYDLQFNEALAVNPAMYRKHLSDLLCISVIELPRVER